ncbi:hypothetical protein PR202_gb02647 [Eleusine coracana subsp. coracana]|uniref:Uncharacterized protein n=1 Tax=Eleusine coracana subsp. coracana TaxID=191504 RepID=A0AAV5DZ84_ELECO|nr:hypothetical protein PR202_gb02647 [Eleusine coracana subsp. coracana]
MGMEDAVRGGGGGGKKLALASIGFVGAAGGGAVYKDDLLVVGLPVPGGDGLDVAGAVPGMAVRLPDVGAAVRTFLRKREVAEFVSGAMAGAMTKAVLAPLETIRTRMVVGVGSKQIFGSFVEIIEQNGWQGLWAGNAINMLRIIPTQAIELGTFEYVKRSMASAQEKWKEDGCPKIQIGDLKIELPLHLLSPIAIGGAAAGIAGTLACHPLEVLKKSLNRPELLVIGAISGLTASTITFPLEVARKRLMVGTLQGKCPPHMIAALADVFQEEGFKGLYRGWAASSLKVMPTSGITWMFYEAWKDLLLAPEPQT